MSNSEDTERARISYQAAISLWKLASDQIYSRFHAMVTANSIIVVANVWFVTQNIDALENPFYFAFPGVGVVFCLLGSLFVWKGITVEDHYREIAYELENKCTTRHIAFDPKKGKRFERIAYTVFGLFFALYGLIIYLLINK